MKNTEGLVVDGAVEAGKEAEQSLNWHLTEAGASLSVGATTKEPGYYPANPDTGEAESWVVPAEFVENYYKTNGLDGDVNDLQHAVLAWKETL